MKVMTVEAEVLEVTWDAKVIAFARERGLHISHDTYPFVFALYDKQARHQRLRERIRRLEDRAGQLDEEICQDFRSYRKALLKS